jgi:hypothetical protein
MGREPDSLRTSGFAGKDFVVSDYPGPGKVAKPMSRTLSRGLALMISCGGHQLSPRLSASGLNKRDDVLGCPAAGEFAIASGVEKKKQPGL